MAAKFRFEPCSACCVACTSCADGVPTEWEVVLSGIGNDACADCASLNGTYLIQKNPTPNFDQAWNVDQANCVWSYEFPSTICSYFVRLDLYVADSGADKVIRVGLSAIDGDGEYYWRMYWGEVFDAPFACLGVEDAVLDDPLLTGAYPTCSLGACSVSSVP